MSGFFQKIGLKQKSTALFPHQQRPTATLGYKTRFSLLGTAGSGKTTVADLILLTMQSMSSNEESFVCDVLEGTSEIEEGTSLLRQGHFPEKTRPYGNSVIEAGFVMERTNRWGTKRIHLPLCDIAGEDIATMIKHKGPFAPSAEEYNQSVRLIEDVRNAEGFIPIIPASRALLFHHDVQIERETGDLPNDPDVNLKRILSAIIEFKKMTHAKPIKAIAAVITKWDLVAPYAAKWGMDIMDPTGQGLQNFMNICFPATSMALKASHVSNIRFFPSFVSVEVDQISGKEKLWADKSPMIRVKPPSEWLTYGRVPEYSGSSYRDLINFLMSYAE